MRFFKKTVTFSLIIAFFTLLLGVTFLYGVKTDPQLGKDIVDLARRAKNIVYRQATIHNPQGDMFPDEIDNDIIMGVKKITE